MKQPEEHQHEWRKVYEEAFIAGFTHIAWECRICSKWVELSELDPVNGLGGTMTKENVLVGINGGRGNCSDGSQYKRQIIHEDGRLEIIR